MADSIQAPLEKINYKQHEFYKGKRDSINIAIENKLSASCWCLWSFLRLLDPFGDRDIDLPSSEELAEILGFSHRQIKRAIAKLQLLELWNFNYQKLKGRNPHGSKVEELTDKVIDFTNSYQESTISTLDDKNVQQKTKMSKSMTKMSKSMTKMSNKRQKCPNQNSEPAPNKDSGTPQNIQTNVDLTDSLSEEKKPSTSEVSIEVDEKTEREREDFSSKKEISETDEVRSQDSPKQELNPSSLPTKDEQPGLKPTNSASRGKGFGARSTKGDHIKTTMPKTFKKLQRDFGYSEADCKEFEEFVHKKVAHFSPPIANYDDYLRKRLQGLVNDFDKTRTKKAEKSLVRYVVIEPEDIPKKEPIVHDRSVKEILADYYANKEKLEKEKSD
jgi:uncharacterized coiled-coil protein SlyX